MNEYTRKERKDHEEGKIVIIVLAKPMQYSAEYVLQFLFPLDKVYLKPNSLVLVIAPLSPSGYSKFNGVCVFFHGVTAAATR
jgi:hypothetical protein